jgi:hypothetical protein
MKATNQLPILKDIQDTESVEDLKASIGTEHWKKNNATECAEGLKASKRIKGIEPQIWNEKRPWYDQIKPKPNYAAILKESKLSSSFLALSENAHSVVCLQEWK